MGKQGKKGKERLDKYYHLAKEQGFRARSAFKLVQLNKDFDFLGGAKVCLDLCAAPGGWLQVAQKEMPLGSTIVGVDLVPIRPIPKVRTVVGDITTALCRSKLRKELSGQKCDVVLHDGAPNVGTAWVQDAFGQNELTLHALRLAVEFLAPNGTFVTKVFRSQDYNKLMWLFQQLFKKVEATKPPASRSVSAEIFVVCQRFAAPERIDPRLLDPRFVFADVDQAGLGTVPESKASDSAAHRQTVRETQIAALVPLTNISKPAVHLRRREGYEDAAISSLYRKTSVLNFLATDDPAHLLGSYHTIEFDAEAAARGITASDEIKELCEDLQVLGKMEFKTLMKWRQDVKAAQKKQDALQNAPASAAPGSVTVRPIAMGSDDTASDSDSDEADRVLTLEEKRERRLLRRAKNAKNKYRQRQALKMNIVNDEIDQTQGEELFSLASLPSVAGGRRFVLPDEYDSDMSVSDGASSASDADENDDADGADDDMRTLRKLRADGSDDDDDDDEYERYFGAREADGADDDDGDDGSVSDHEREYEDRVESELEQMYKEFKERRGLDEGVKRRADREREEDQQLMEMPSAGLAHGRKLRAHASAGYNNNDDDDDGATIKKAGGLLLLPPAARSKKDKEEEFFSSSLFASLPSPTAAAVSASPAVAAAAAAAAVATGAPSVRTHKRKVMPVAVDSDDDGDDPASKMKQKRKEEILNRLYGNQLAGKRAASRDAAEAGPTFEEVRKETYDPEDTDELLPISSGDALDDEQEQRLREEMSQYADSDMDSDEEAECRAIALKMLRRKDRMEIMENAWNKYTFNDPDLPEWFLEDEREHSQISLPVTKQEVEAARLRAKQLDARPLKKVVEAKHRKQKRLSKKVELMKKKMNVVAENEELSERDRQRQLEKMAMKKASLGKEKVETKYVVTKRYKRTGGGAPGVKVKKGTKVKRVDGRLKKDKRSAKLADMKKGGGGKRRRR